jgi:hypothetical protein
MNQFQKTPEEKLAIKEAKKAYKRGDRTFASEEREPLSIPLVNGAKRILTGKMPDEPILADKDPIIANFMYVAEMNDGTYKVTNANWSSRVQEFRNKLNKPPFTKGTQYVIAIRRCNLGARNLY